MNEHRLKVVKEELQALKAAYRSGRLSFEEYAKRKRTVKAKLLRGGG